MKKILLISNDKIYLKNETVSNENNDTLNIIEAIQKSYNIFLISRILNKKKKLVIKCKNKIKRFDLRSFLIKKKDFKILMISITPRNLFYYFFINIFYGKIDGYVYLRSNGHLEYKSKIGKIGYLVYDTMYNFIQKRLKIIKVSNNIKSNGKAALLIPSELDQHWLKKTRNIKPVIPKLLYFGRFKKEKGVFSLLNLIKNFDFKFKLTMAGDNNMFLGKKKIMYFFCQKFLIKIKLYPCMIIIISLSYHPILKVLQK